SPSPQREATRLYLLRVVEALRTGRIRIINRRSTTPFRPRYDTGPSVNTAEQTFRTDIFDDPASARIIATFELPGVKIPDLTVTVKQRILTVRGERRPRYGQTTSPATTPVRARTRADSATQSHVNQPGSRLFPLQEFIYGSFSRSLYLPAGVDTSLVDAYMSDGLLTVSWPREP
ncbi:HSP20-like chaperone, partial [Mycena vitilis]